METTFTHTSEKTQSKKTSNEGSISKKALITFISGATIVFGSAIYYCLSTEHKAEAGLITGAYVLVCIYAAFIYRSIK